MTLPEDDDWAQAIALRLSDEWAGKSDFPNDAELLCRVLTRLFKAHPDETRKLIGTGIIEENYFANLI